MWSDGFHAFTIATGSRPKALEAWGVRQDLFKSGLAHEIDAGSEYEAALARPGEVIQSGVAIDVGKLTTAPKTSKANTSSKAAEKRVAGLERELEALDAAQAEQAARLEEEIKALEKRRDAAAQSRAKARAALVARLKSARAKG